MVYKKPRLNTHCGRDNFQATLFYLFIFFSLPTLLIVSLETSYKLFLLTYLSTRLSVFLVMND